jgi:hypothetical protein
VDLEGGIVGYPSNPPATGNQPPTTVKVSTYLLWLTAALSLISAVVTLSVVGTMTEAYRDLYAGTAAEGSEAVIVGVSVVGVVISVLFAVGLAVLAIFNNRGRNGSRITTWVIGGISVCCTGLGLAGTALTNSMNFSDTSGGPSQAEVQRRLDEVLPSWYDSVTVALSVLSLLALLGAMILLALPASNAFFRKPAAGGWDPSQPYPYPGGQPPYPGQGQPPYPGQGEQPPYPAYPGQQPGQPTYPPPSYPGQGAPDPATPPPPGPPSGSQPPSPPGSSGASAAEPPGGSSPHTGGTPPTDPWSRPDDRRPSDPTS